MKKLFWLAPMALIMLFSPGCKKDAQISPQQPLKAGESVAVATNKSIETLIAETNAKYGTHYSAFSGTESGMNTMASTITYEETKGIFYIPQKGPRSGDPANGYCLPHNTNVCHITITVSASDRKAAPLWDVVLNTPQTPYLIKGVKAIAHEDVKDNNGIVIGRHYEFIK